MVRPFKKKQIPNLQTAIKEAAWKQIAEEGAAALSLRALGRFLRITAPAIYNYFPDRDALVTALIIDAYGSFGDSQIAARDAAPDNLSRRLTNVGLAYRKWARTHPQRYQLIFGSPIPGYQAPLAQIQPAAARSLSAVVSVVEALRAAGKLKVKNFPKVSATFKNQFQSWKRELGDVSDLSLSIAMTVWSRAHGIVSLEIAGGLPPFGPKGDDLYLFEMDSIINQFIKE